MDRPCDGVCRSLVLAVVEPYPQAPASGASGHVCRGLRDIRPGLVDQRPVRHILPANLRRQRSAVFAGGGRAHQSGHTDDGAGSVHRARRAVQPHTQPDRGQPQPCRPVAGGRRHTHLHLLRFQEHNSEFRTESRTLPSVRHLDLQRGGLCLLHHDAHKRPAAAPALPTGGLRVLFPEIRRLLDAQPRRLCGGDRGVSRLHHRSAWFPQGGEPHGDARQQARVRPGHFARALPARHREPDRRRPDNRRLLGIREHGEHHTEPHSGQLFLAPRHELCGYRLRVQPEQQQPRVGGSLQLPREGRPGRSRQFAFPVRAQGQRALLLRRSVPLSARGRQHLPGDGAAGVPRHGQPQRLRRHIRHSPSGQGGAPRRLLLRPLRRL